MPLFSSVYSRSYKDALLSILWYLSPQQLAKFQRVDKESQRLGNDPLLWKRFLLSGVDIPAEQDIRSHFICHPGDRQFQYLHSDTGGVALYEELQGLKNACRVVQFFDQFPFFHLDPAFTLRKYQEMADNNWRFYVGGPVFLDEFNLSPAFKAEVELALRTQDGNDNFDLLHFIFRLYQAPMFTGREEFLLSCIRATIRFRVINKQLLVLLHDSDLYYLLENDDLMRFLGQAIIKYGPNSIDGFLSSLGNARVQRFLLANSFMLQFCEIVMVHGFVNAGEFIQSIAMLYASDYSKEESMIQYYLGVAIREGFLQSFSQLRQQMIRVWKDPILSDALSDLCMVMMQRAEKYARDNPSVAVDEEIELAFDQGETSESESQNNDDEQNALHPPQVVEIIEEDEAFVPVLSSVRVNVQYSVSNLFFAPPNPSFPSLPRESVRAEDDQHLARRSSSPG